MFKLLFCHSREIESDSLKECHNLVDLSEDTDDNDGDEVETYYADLSNPMSSPKVTSLSAVGEALCFYIPMLS